MAGEVHHILVSYDIHDPKRLLKVAKIMKDYGERVLKSVFECNLSEDEFRRMKTRIEDRIDHMEDSVRFHFICGKCVENVDKSGHGGPFLVEKEVLIT